MSSKSVHDHLRLLEPLLDFNYQIFCALNWWQAEELVVSRPLNLVERAVALALAVSLDNDYFSRHSQPG